MRADELGAVLHHAQPEARNVVPVLKASAVIVDIERQIPRLVVNLDDDAGGVRVFARIGHRFLRDAIELSRNG